MKTLISGRTYTVEHDKPNNRHLLTHYYRSSVRTIAEKNAAIEHGYLVVREGGIIRRMYKITK